MAAVVAVWERSAAVWADWMWSMAWQVALAAGAVWVLTRLLRKSSAAFRYTLWLLVFVRLVVPPWFTAPWSLGSVLDRLPALELAAPPVTSEPGTFPVASPVPPSIAPVPSLPVPAVPRLAVEDIPEDWRTAPSMVGVPVAPAPLPAAAEPSWRPTQAAVAMAVWLLVSLGMMGAVLFQGLRYRRRILCNLSAPAPETQRIVAAQAERLGLRRAYRVRVSPHIRIPVVMGFARPLILLPARLVEALTEDQFADLAAHELAHVKRRDVQWGWPAALLVCLYWFHPAVWLANLHLRREREMACDDEVLYATRKEGRKYASTIVRVAESFEESVPAGAGFLGLMEVSENLLERIRAAADATRRRRFGLRSAVALVLFAAVLLPMGVWTPATLAQESPVEAEIAQHYSGTDDEVKGFIRQTAERFGPEGLWLSQNAFDGLSPEQREEKVKAAVEALEGPGALEAHTALAEAGALQDPRLVPGLTRVAWHFRPGGQDNRAKWMAVLALGRQDDKRAVPVLVPLVDHYNLNVRLWARAALNRLTGQYFGADKKAWTEWANAAGPETAIAPAVLEWASQQSEDRMKAAQAANTAVAPARTDLEAAAREAVEKHYAAAAPEVKEYILWTARTFGPGGMWYPEGAFDALTSDQREEKVRYIVGVLESEYGRHQCQALAEAGALQDPRLVPGLAKAAGYHRQDGDYDCRPKWIAVSSLGRQGDLSAGPLLIDLVDHGNQNTRMWARASLARLTNQNFGEDKQAWGRWWNESGHSPQIDLAELKPWSPPAPAASAPSTPPAVEGEAKPAPVPVETQAIVDALPGEVAFKGTYNHLSRGNPLPEASTVWIKGVAEGEVVAVSYLPSFDTTYVSHFAPRRDLIRYETRTGGKEGGPSTVRTIELSRGTVTVTHRGGEKDGQVETHTVPGDAAFIPNTRPDPYAMHMAAFFGSLPDRSQELECFDWDNSGKGFARYRIRIDAMGKETITVPAGTFEANHYVETQLTSGDTWFKKRAGHITDYWVLDTGVAVAIQRHREPYEVYLAQYESPDPLPNRVEASAHPAGHQETNAEAQAMLGRPVADAAPPKTPQPPNLISSEPAMGATEVDPATSAIRVTFDQDMSGGFSWTGGGEHYPDVTDRPHWVDKRTCAIPVRLEPGRLYRIGINSKSHHGFKSAAGIPVRPQAIAFTTTGAPPELVEGVKPPQVVSMEPADGASGVSPALDKLTVTFNVPMGGGCSWTGGGDTYPETTGPPAWSDDRKTCVLPVKLKPGTRYRVGLNSYSHSNFQSAHGVPLDPVEWDFMTGP